jgi:hypothetical protein
VATVLRGLALVAVAGRVVGLWNRRGFVDRARSVLVAVGLAGDWMLVVATAVDLVVTVADAALVRWPNRLGTVLPRVAFAASLVVGGAFLARHDTESGHRLIIASLAALIFVLRLMRTRTPGWNKRRLAWASVGCWAVPVAACVAAQVADPRASWAAALIERCRFSAVPTDDVERLALWCRAHTPADARFIGPPGPKTFRLWSQRSLAFNRAASPYHAEGLADWAARFRDHVGFQGSYTELVRAYQLDRHALERRYQAMTDAERASLAKRQGATYVVAAPPARPEDAGAAEGPLELLHVEGRYAVYRVRPVPQVRTVATTSDGTG